MPRRPNDTVLNAAKRTLDPKAVLNATINDMHDKELEQRLVDAGLARYVEENQ